jgi:hypothetical protein
MAAKQVRISVESLRPVKVLYEGDIHDLACLLLRLFDARDRETNSRNTGSVCRSRPTVNGLAMYYSLLASNVSTERVREVLRRYTLPLGAVVDDQAVPKVAPAAVRQGDGTGRRRGRRKPPDG